MSDWFSSLFNTPAMAGEVPPPYAIPGAPSELPSSGQIPMVNGPAAQQPNALVPQPQERRVISERVVPPPVPPPPNSMVMPPAAPPMNPWDPMTEGPPMPGVGTLPGGGEPAPPVPLRSPSMMAGAPARPPGAPMDIRPPAAGGPGVAPQGGADKLMSLMRNIKAPPQPQAQKVSTPRAPQQTPMQSGQLMALLQQIGLQGRLPGIGGIGRG
jgi:hypothetical protein